MIYDPVTGKLIGELTRFTDEDRRRSEKLIADGVIVSSKRPSEDDLKKSDAYLEGRDRLGEIAAAVRIRQRREGRR